MHALNYVASFSSAHLVFLELEDVRQHIDFQTIDENNN